MKATILIAAEEPRVQRLIQANLQLWGYGVLQAVTGSDALRQAQTLRPALVILDMTLPDMDGYEFLVRLKKHEYGRTLPILALTTTAQDAEFWSKKWEQYGEWLHKPFDPLALLRSIKLLLFLVNPTFEGGPAPQYNTEP